MRGQFEIRLWLRPLQRLIDWKHKIEFRNVIKSHRENITLIELKWLWFFLWNERNTWCSMQIFNVIMQALIRLKYFTFTKSSWLLCQQKHVLLIYTQGSVLFSGLCCCCFFEIKWKPPQFTVFVLSSFMYVLCLFPSCECIVFNSSSVKSVLELIELRVNCVTAFWSIV